MAIAYPLFYNSISGDRIYNADSFSDWLTKFFTTGVFSGEFNLSVNGMYITLTGGYVNIKGKVMIFDETTLELPVADASYDRIDNVVIERNDGDRQFYIKVVSGSPSTVPVAPTPVRSGGVYQLVLYRVRVAAGATSVNMSNVTDTRPDSALCGIVTGTVQEMDFSAFTAKFEDYYNTFVSENQQNFTTWFQNIQYVLDGDVAGHLQNEIDNDVVARENPAFTLPTPYEREQLYILANGYFGWRNAFYNGSAYISVLLTEIIGKLKEHEATKVVCVPGISITGIPANSSYTINLSQYFDTTKYSLWNVDCVLNSEKLPYIGSNGATSTRVRTINADSIVIENNASAWGAQTAYITLYLRRKAD